MYNVALIDDEMWALRGLKSACQWEKLDCQIILEETNPIQALEYIFSNNVDIAFIDIFMVGLTGIDILKAAYEKKIKTKFIIVSGHDNFEYAQKAVQYNAFHYLLKPINKAEVNSVMQNLTRYLKLEQNKNYTDSAFEIIDNIMYSNLINNISDLFKHYERPILNPTFQIAISDIVKDDIVNMLNQSPDISAFSICLGTKNEVIFINTPSDRFLYAQTHLKEMFAKSKKVIAFSSLFESTSNNLMSAYLREASIAYSTSYIHTDRYVFSYNDISPSFENDIVSIFSKIKVPSKKISDFVLTFPNLCIEQNLNICDVELYYNLIITALNYLLPSNKSSVNDLEYMHFDEIPLKFKNLNEMNKHLISLISLIHVSPEESDESKSSFDQILDYIKTNFNSEIFLSDLSEKFFYQTTYICYLFKKHLNTTFSEYLKNIRLEKSRQFLHCDMPIALVAQKSGYNDYCHYSRQFKAKYGMPPSKYRKQIQKEA